MDSLPKRPNTPPSPPRRGSRHVSPPTAQRPGPSSWEPRARSPGVWDRDRGRPMYRPRSRSRSRSYDYNYDFPRRRTPPPPHPHSRLPRRPWERSRSRSPPQQPKSSVPCKYFSRPTGCDKGNRCRFRHEAPRSRSFTRSRSRSRSPPRSPRSRSPPLRYRGDSPMLVPRGGMRSPQPSLLQRLGPVAHLRPVSPMRPRAASNDPNEPLEEGEERSPGLRAGNTKPRGKRRSDRKGNWDSFVADEDEEMSEYEGGGSKREHDSRRGRSHSRSPRPQTRSLSKSRSRSPRNTAATTTRSNSQEKRSHHPPPSRSRSHSRSPHSPTRSHDRSRSRGRSRTRSRTRSSSRPPRSRSRSPYRQSHRTRDREPWTERDHKSATPAPNPGPSTATVSAVGPPIPTGPRLRTGVNPPPAPTTIARIVPAAGRGGAPPTGPRGDREPPRGPRNMVGLNAGPPASAPNMNSGPGWERPQLAFQSYLAAVQSKLDERQGKRKDDDTADDDPNLTDATMSGVKREPDAMDLDAPEEHVGRSFSNTPAPGHSVEASRVASPAHPNPRQSSASLHASPLVGQSVSLPVSSAFGPAYIPQLAQPHSLPLPPRPRSPPPRPRSPPRGPRATRGLPEKPKGVGLEPGREGGTERDRGADIIERGRDRNDWDKGRVSGEPERKPHLLAMNSVRQVRVPTPRATTRNSLFPELEKEVSLTFLKLCSRPRPPDFTLLSSAIGLPSHNVRLPCSCSFFSLFVFLNLDGNFSFQLLAILEEQRTRLANEHFPLEIALRQAADELALSTIECRAAEDRRIMTETVLEAMVKGSGLAAGGEI
ncbi:hypothetical protein B0J17DRAFT_646676 [Rhizoctonia solani]|nr:hypothetical protein B0J17DRAFT_646676 [Rhizoctonia solani]